MVELDDDTVRRSFEQDQSISRAGPPGARSTVQHPARDSSFVTMLRILQCVCN